MIRFNLLLAFLLVSNIVFAQAPPGLSSIKKEDLKKDVYDLADARFRGRAAGTIDELNASMWIAEKYRSIGVKPAGDNGSYLQFFSMWRNKISRESVISINNKTYALWKDVAIAQMAPLSTNTAIEYLGPVSSIDMGKVDVRGKFIAIDAGPGIINYAMSLPGWRYGRNFMTQYGTALVNKGVTGIILIADPETEAAWPDAVENFKQGSFDIEGGPNMNVTATVPVLWVHASAKNELMNNARIKATIAIEHFQYPSVNIVGYLDGTDPVLSREYVLFSGHQDAHGIRNIINNDSIYYGADDNASVDASIFAIARAFKKNPGKRSVLFVIHGAEERGLLGSKWYSSHPTVPVDNIVAVLNGDMIGRNNIDSAALMGVLPPHLNSSDLIQMAMDANKEGPNFKITTEWDKTTHPEFWYFRSDHLPYARLGIPAAYYSSLLHPDYHTPMDNAANINYDKLKKMCEWIYRTGWKVANAPRRPNRELNFKLER
jgi:hypothetical protein